LKSYSKSPPKQALDKRSLIIISPKNINNGIGTIKAAINNYSKTSGINNISLRQGNKVDNIKRTISSFKVQENYNLK